MLTFLRFALGLMLVLTSLFLILLVLIQRGRGGGLTGALGGAGGQSAFGTKAGDVFTRITVGVAAFWIGLCILALNMLGQRESLFSGTLGGNAPQAVMPTTPSTPPAGGQPAPVAAPGANDVILPGQEPAAQPESSDAKPAAEAAAPAAPAADVPPPAAPDAAPVPSAPAEAK
jgi:preprotein translocase subunit SecG